ncbi:autophagy-related protein 22-like protein [Halteromyces radiatus]|uniref:autophagy-related protein 22-like protein n=1 Tax=Halteromyces radiatus TaxID=101107 RepID=UPI0022206824|nr:autophagy-related protein 22-like protein [Halteromyces radiatus]KAI8086410.1 autophagy-related protein 22-like protein [Halteromyces radiatus]
MSSELRWQNDPFKVRGRIDPTTEIGREVLKQPPATRYELWSYYLYYNGNNGYNLYYFLPTFLQYLAQQGGFDPTKAGRPKCQLTSNTDNAPCNVPWLNLQDGIPVVSMVMYVTAISFSAQFVIFTTFGSLADYGRYNHYILIVATLISCVAQILPIFYINNDGSGWITILVLNIIALTAYGVTLVFYTAAFPLLSDNLPLVRSVRADPMISIEETQLIVEKWRNHVSAVSTAFSNIGFLIYSGVFVGVSFIPWYNGPFVNDQSGTFGNTLAYYCIGSVVGGAYCLVNALPYFILRPVGRKGPPLPPDQSHFTVGWKSIFQALKEAKKYRYLYLYIVSYFLFTDGVNAISVLQQFLQNEITDFSATANAGMGLVTAVFSLIGCFFFLFLAKQFTLSTKTILMTIVVTTGILPLWGCFGIGMDNFGIKTVWELWVSSAWSGFFTGPIWAWEQTMLAQLVPPGKENLFFGLFGIASKASSWMAFAVIGAVTEKTANPYYGWLLIAILFVLATIILWYVDMEAAKLEMLHIEMHQELLDRMATNRISSPPPLTTTTTTEASTSVDGTDVIEKVPIIKLELYSDGSKK